MITTLKKILVPTDFSQTSKKALHYATALAESTGAKITILNVIDPPFNFPTNVEGVLDYLQDNSEGHLNDLLTQIEEKFPNKSFKIKSQVRIGKPVSQIMEAISDLDIDLVVMGSGADSPARKILFGSVSTDIILRSPKPVLVIPEKVNGHDAIENFGKILFTTNFRNGDYKNLKKINDFAKHFHSTINVLHVTDKEDLDTEIKYRGFKQLVEDEQLSDNIKFDLKIHDDAFEGISEYIASNYISLMVMNRYKKSIVGLLMDKNYAKKLSVYSEIPLLVLIGE